MSSRSVVFMYCFMLVILFAQRAYGIEISPNYASIQAGKPIQFSIKAIFVFPDIAAYSYQVNCYLDINFGDGTGWRTIGLCKDPFCFLTSSHIYQAPGDYTVLVRSSPYKCERKPVSPDPATAKVLVTCLPLVIKTASLPSGRVDRSYAARIIAGGGAPPYHFSLVDGTLPPGLFLTSSGEIKGIPTQAGYYNFSVEITDSCFNKPQRVVRKFSIEVMESCKPMAFVSPEVLPSGKVGVSYSERLSISGGYPPIRFQIVSGFLPEGLRMSTSGDLMGVPQKSGYYSFVVEAQDSCPYGSQKITGRFSLRIQEACNPLDFITSSVLSSGVIGAPYSERILVRGGYPPLGFKILSGSLPPGLTLNPDGSISGICQSPGDYSFVVEVSDKCPGGIQRKAKEFFIKVIQKGFSVFVTTNPETIRVPRRSRFTQTVSYHFVSTPSASFMMKSTRGIFMTGAGLGLGGGTVLGTVYKTLQVNVINGAGSASEVLEIPPAISMRAERLGVYKIRYVREFVGEGQRVIAIVSIYFTTEAAGGFRIKRIRLFFENNRPEITIKRNAPPPKIYAEIQYSGSGLLRAYWEVDGRILHRVFKHLSYGNVVTLETPSVPPVPTFTVGSHVVRFVVTNPRQVFKFPEAVYFVSAEPYVSRNGIELLKPINGAEVSVKDLSFSWRLRNKASIFAFLVEFFKKPMEKAFFSALVKGGVYAMPEKLSTKVFSPDKSYLWRVQGLDREGKVVAESGFGTFFLQSKAEYVENQVVILLSKKSSTYVVNLLQKQFSLRLLYSFDLASLNATVAVFYTSGDVESTVKSIRSKFKNLMVQPNYIYRTMVEDLENLQVEYKLLGLAGIHKKWIGKGITVAVVDTGIDINHDDIKPHVKKAENFIRQEEYRPEIHGTAVAGLICASKNGVGTTGVAPGVRILAMRACRQIAPDSPDAECYSSSIAEAVDRAVLYGANVINMSFGSPADDSILRRIIEKTSEKGRVVFVAPAGNNPNLTRPRFPASIPEVIAVAGYDLKGNVYPNKKMINMVDVIAPYKNIMTTFPNGQYNFISGTSMSSAIVSAFVALSMERGLKSGIRNIVEQLEKPVDIVALEEKIFYGDLPGTPLQRPEIAGTK